VTGAPSAQRDPAAPASAAARVSVVIPTRDRRAFLERALGTVLAQRGVSVETIVVDDGSRDGTTAYLESLNEPRIVVVRHDAPTGVAQARNDGVARASSPWVAFIDDDDVWAPGKVAAQIAAIDATEGAEWACAGAVILDRTLEPTAAQRLREPADTLSRLLSYNVVPGGASGVLASTELVSRVGAFDPALRVFADWDLWIRLAMATPVAYADAPLVGYVLHGANMTAGDVDVLEELDRIEEKTAGIRLGTDVEIDRDLWEAWLADMSRRGGARLRPAASYLRLAARSRRPAFALRAVSIALRPGFAERQDAKRRAALDPDWRARAEAWLEPLRRSFPPDGLLPPTSDLQ
jgi:glycosyltransferase involved in cell wall biosynthesis